MPSFKMTTKLKYTSLYFFRYNDPVTKNKLSVWDKAPLVIPLVINNKTMLGINIHWVPKFMRMKFIRLALSLAEKVVKGKQVKILPRIFYDSVKNGPFKFALKGIRKYYISRITNIQEIPPEFWNELKPSDGRFKGRMFYKHGYKN